MTDQESKDLMELERRESLQVMDQYERFAFERD
jgi:hypothetical protein